MLTQETAAQSWQIQIWPIDRSQNEFSHVAIFSMRSYVVVTTPKLAQGS
jgi:hypothetical protein